MSLRQVLTIYNAERQLNEDDTALLNTLRRLKDADRELLVQELSNKPQKKPGSERVYERCAQCGTTKGHRYHKDSSDDGYHEFQTPAKSTKKSLRASGMAAAISNSLESSRKAAGLKAAMTFCAKPDCGLNQSSDIHDAAAGYAGYHEFQPPQQAEAAAGSGD